MLLHHNADKTPKLELAVKTPFKGEPVDPDSPLLSGARKIKAQNMKGCATWMCTKCRSDCQPACLGPCRQMQAPTEQSIAQVEWLWRCVLGSLDWVLGVRKDPKHMVDFMTTHYKVRSENAEEPDRLWSKVDAAVYTDAGWTLPRSISGKMVRVFGLLVNSSTTLQNSTADSSTASEIIGMMGGTKEGVWTRYFTLEALDISEERLKECGKTLPIAIYGDNMGALKFAREHCVGSKLKHLPAAYYYMHEKSEAGEVSYHQVNTVMNLADFWTKFHNAASVDRHRAQWMLRLSVYKDG